MIPLLSRFALAAVVVALTAAGATMLGSGAGESLGSLFGYESRLEAPSGLSGSPVHGIATAPSVDSPRRVKDVVPRARHRTPTRRAAVRREPRPAPVAAPVPVAPSAPPPSPPVAPRPPAPAPSGTVDQVARTVREVTAQAAPPVKQPVEQALGAVDRACGLIGGCP